MIPIGEALDLIGMQPVKPSETEISLDRSSGYVLSKPIYAPFDLPSFDNSAMDGYAVCGQHSEFIIIGEIAAGSTGTAKMNDGEAMRIFTGGMIPHNTTAVIMQEKTSVNGNTLIISDTVEPGKNIRLKGNELSEDQLVFEAGHKISPASAGVIASLGFDRISVFKKPVVSVIATGDELIDPGEPIEPGQIYDSNSIALSMVLNSYDLPVSVLRKIKDDEKAITEGVGAVLKDCDVLLISGGISVGDYDFTKKALEDNGVEEIFYKVYQKPGKPLYFGKKGKQYVFALPGNPASSLTCFYVYVLPLLDRLSGRTGEGLQRVELPLSHDHEIGFDRPVFLKAKLENGKVKILDGQGSSMIHSMAQGNALAFVEGPVSLRSGDTVKCLLLE